jgi:hypothetical protein
MPLGLLRCCRPDAGESRLAGATRSGDFPAGLVGNRHRLASGQRVSTSSAPATAGTGSSPSFPILLTAAAPLPPRQNTQQLGQTGNSVPQFTYALCLIMVKLICSITPCLMPYGQAEPWFALLFWSSSCVYAHYPVCMIC